MKNLIRTGLFVFSIFVIQTTIASATEYDYLPNDVFLVQQAEKSALEYRLRTIENQYQSNPQTSIFSIDQRISELQSQRDSEKEYLKGTLAHNGAYSPETWASYSAKIDAKYDPQINSLNQQKQTYQSQVSGQQQKDQEVAELKRLILEMQNSIDKQADIERKKVLDDFASRQQKLSDEYRAKIAIEQQKLIDESATVPPKEDFSKVDVNKMFLYLDALASTDASNLWQRIHKNNPEVAARINILYYKKYPNGKYGDLKNVAPAKSNQKVTNPKTIKEQKQTLPTKQVVKETEIKATSTEESGISVVQTEQTQELKPTQEKHTIRERVSGFFKRIFRIN